MDEERREIVHNLVQRISIVREGNEHTVTLKLLGGPELQVSVRATKRRLDPEGDPVDMLSQREMAVLWQLHKDLSRKRIAELMDVQPGAINTYVAGIRKRFDGAEVVDIIQRSLPRIEKVLASLPLEGAGAAAAKRLSAR